jgi:hypothetical protein
MELHSRVSLVSGLADTNRAGDSPTLAKSLVFDGAVGYLRVGHVGEGLAGQISAACKVWAAGTNAVKGLVLDLRYAGGRDYAAAAAVANLFVGKAQPLLDWGNGAVRSDAKSDAINLPVAVLVNRQTSGAAEALAGVLRQDDDAVILGSNTAGEATIDEEFPLTTGQRLRIATATVKLGNGQTLSERGLTPDIAVTIAPEDERAYYDDPFRDIERPLNLASSFTGGGTNAAATNHNQGPRLTEADLIRERTERPGLDMDYAPLYTDAAASASGGAPQKPVVRDPVLGRALDLIKGISAVLRTQRPS